MAVITYKCPNCGGGLVFDPKSQQFKCEYCLSGFSEEELKARTGAAEEEYKAAPSGTDSARAEAAMMVYSCPSCGAEIVAEETTAATSCYYCHNPVVLSGKLDGAYEPDSVIPFEVDQKTARERFKEWIGKKRYVPGDFYSPEQMKRLGGIYYPYWTFGCTVEGSLKAEGIRNKNMAAVSGYVDVETSRFAVELEGKMQIGHVARAALKKADRQLSERVLPFDMEKTRPFKAGYLSGFRAERRDRGQEEFSEEVESEVRSFAREALLGNVSGYDQVRVQQQTENIKDKSWSYCLFPVWIMTYQRKKDGKMYYFAMNGQTGKICGMLPVDGKKLAVLFMSVFLPVFLLLLIGGYLI